MHNRNHLRSSGFTIVELIVVIIVVAILAILVYVAYNIVLDRVYAARITAAVEEYRKGFQAYYETYGKFPEYDGTWGTCLGSTADYPAADGFPAGACYMRYDVNGNVIDVEYASDNLAAEINKFMSPAPDPRIRIVTEPYSSGQSGKYRGLYYEHQDNSKGSSYADWGYIEYVSHGKIECPHVDYYRYRDQADVTFCGFLIWAGDN